ncbi:MAG: response regulator transcription factor [Acidobacteria bacterium]|nr:response regulator transcription factor [Acidobacteriota bacterium]
MRILIAEDDPMSRRLLDITLNKWGYGVVATCDGTQAWEAMQQEDAPQLAILDWMMPGLDGLQICRMARETPATKSIHIILLTAKGEKSDLVECLAAGANDFVTKPFDRDELRARVQVGVRMVELQRSLADRVKELESALSQVRQLQGILPICAHCKNVRDDQNYWQKVEHYVSEHSEAQFSHSVCPDCYASIVEPELEELKRQRNAPH